ncbi:MAG: aldehyde dehydrogenase family protein [Acidobacteria bacterium]|nr:MAG: aldehyde dehydrogenase family protein [Acidobacteriota bacterium]
MLHLPVLRGGKPYLSLDTIQLKHVGTGETVALVSQANPGLIARDLILDARHNRQILAERPVSELISMSRRAADLFMTGRLPMGDVMQGPDEFVAIQSATTGVPRALCHRNMEKIRFVLAEMERILMGLTRGLDLSVLDEGWNGNAQRPVSYLSQADMLGAVLPSNSPGVHALWLPAVAMKVPLVLRPGRQEPWTPFRVIQAFLAAGCPPEALSFYPSDYAGATEILSRCHRSLFFGDAATVKPWLHDRRIELHGPGKSKVLLAPDQISRWEDHVELMAASIADNGGRSCVNASGVWVGGRAPGLAEALAEKLAAMEPLPLDHPDARLAAFGDVQVARRISDFIDDHLQAPGAEDLTAPYYKDGRVVEMDGLAFLRPTLIRCTDPAHALARAELLFPFAAYVEVPPADLLDLIGPTLVGTVLTGDDRFAGAAMECRHIERLNLGSIPTGRVSWDQPHEGNLFELLYHRRAFQNPASAASAAA